MYIEGDNNRVAGTVLASGYSSDTIRVASGANNIINQSAYSDGARVDSGATDNRLYGDLNWSGMNNSGTRTTINDLGLNAGDPSSTGDWNGNGYEGVVVKDTTNGPTYKYVNGSWEQIAA